MVSSSSSIMGDLRDDGVRPDRGLSGRAVSDADPLHVDVAAVPHRQRLVRRHAATDRDGDGGATATSIYGLWYPIVVVDHDGIIVRSSSRDRTPELRTLRPQHVALELRTVRSRAFKQRKAALSAGLFSVRGTGVVSYPIACSPIRGRRRHVSAKEGRFASFSASLIEIRITLRASLWPRGAESDRRARIRWRCRE